MSKKNKVRKNLWFRAKQYGWGWYPITWQGWAVTALYVVLYTVSGVLFGALAPAVLAGGGSVAAGALLLISWTILLSASLLAVCYRYGEPPRWRWGSKD
ncbi:MAG: hypothetical protein AAB883_00435 [Patescibacteria group bacterium]